MRELMTFSLIAAATLRASAMPHGLGTTGVATDQLSSAKLFARLGNNNGNTPHDAIDVTIDCTDMEDVCDMDAYAMLCLNAERILQRASETERRRHYRISGANSQPFVNQSNLDRFGVVRPPGHDDYTSAEEFPFASGNVQIETGRMAFVFPAPQEQQQQQGQTLLALYRRMNISVGKWFNIRGFSNCNRPYCQAFNDNDVSVCRDQLKPGFTDWAKYAFQKISKYRAKVRFDMVGKMKPHVSRNVGSSDQQLGNSFDERSPLEERSMDDDWFAEGNDDWNLQEEVPFADDYV